MPWTENFSQPYAFLLNNALVNKLAILEIATHVTLFNVQSYHWWR